MTLSGNHHTCMTYSKQNVKAPKHVTLSGPFSLISYFNSNLYNVNFCIDFVLFLKGLNMREFQNTEKFVTFLKSLILQKVCIAVSNVGFYRNSSKNRSSLSIQRDRKCSGISIYLRVCHWLSQRHFDEIKRNTRKPPGNSFYFSFTLVFFLFFSYFVFACTFFLLCFSKTKEKTSKT